MGIQKKNFSEIISFTRASGGTSFRPVGRGVLVNRLMWSGDFRDAAWLGGGNGKPTFISSQVTDPFGGNSAYSCTVATDGWQARQDVAIASTPMTMAVWARTTTGTSTALGLLLNNDQLFLRPTVTTEWQLFVVSGTVGALSGSGRCGVLVDTNSTLLVSRAAVFSGIFTAQQILDNGGIPITFASPDNVVRIDTPGDPIQLFTVPANYPRRDYDPVTGACKGLLVEEQRTNMLLWSNDFTNAAWVKSPSGVGVAPQLSPQPVAAPDGTMTATRVTLTNTGTTTGDWSWLYSNSSCVSGVTYCASALVRASTPADVGKQIVWPSVGANKLITLSADWVLAENAATCSASTTYSFGPRLRGSETTATTVTLDICHAQLEVGEKATSRIPTTGAAATRAADIPVINTLSPWYNPQEGTLLVDVGSSKASSIAMAAAASLVGPNIGTNYIVPAFNSTGTSAIFSGGSNIATAAAVVGQFAKVAIGMSPTSQSLVVNGGTPVTRTAAAPLDVVSALLLGHYGSTPGALNGHITRIRYIPKRLSDAKLQALTTLTYGAPYGPELATGWAASGVGVAVSGQSVVLTNASPSAGVGIAGGQLIATKTYVMTMTISGFSSDVGGISFCSGGMNGAGIGAIYTANGTFTQTITAATTETFGIRARNSNVTATVMCSVREATAQ